MQGLGLNRPHTLMGAEQLVKQDDIRFVHPMCVDDDMYERHLALMRDLKAGKRNFGTPAASMLSNVDGNGNVESLEGVSSESVLAGVRGERITSELLSTWAEHRPCVVHVDSVRTPQYGHAADVEHGRGDTDHLMIAGNSVLIIDSKAWKNYSTYRIENPDTITRNGQFFAAGYNMHMKRNFQQWTTFFPDMSAFFQNAVCISNPEARETSAGWTINVEDTPASLKCRWQLCAQQGLWDLLDAWYARAVGWNPSTGKFLRWTNSTTFYVALINRIVDSCIRISADDTDSAYDALVGRTAGGKVIAGW